MKTDKQKIEAFDNLHEMAMKYFDSVMAAKAYPVDWRSSARPKRNWTSVLA